MDDEKKPRKQDKRTEEVAHFDGFPWDILNEDYSQLPNIWIKLVAVIQNLSELKVVLYILRHTWGFQEYDIAKHITVDEFINGRKRKDGTRMDIGTGLTKQSVLNGVEQALEHGFIVCEVDDSDPGRIKKYYKLKMQPAREEQEDGVKNLDPQVKIVDPSVKNLYHSGQKSLHRSKNELENQPLELTEENVIRITPPSENFSEGENGYTPEFIRGRIEDFSRILGDYEHIGQNISQANRVYRESGIDPDTFVEAMKTARELAQKATIKKTNSQGRPNRMPYFFKCLERALKAERTL